MSGTSVTILGNLNTSTPASAVLSNFQYVKIVSRDASIVLKFISNNSRHVEVLQDRVDKFIGTFFFSCKIACYLLKQNSAIEFLGSMNLGSVLRKRMQCLSILIRIGRSVRFLLQFLTFLVCRPRDTESCSQSGILIETDCERLSGRHVFIDILLMYPE